MKYVAKSHEDLMICSMGKQFRVRCIATTDNETNAFAATHRDTGLIAILGPFQFTADLYSGKKLTKESQWDGGDGTPPPLGSWITDAVEDDQSETLSRACSEDRCNECTDVHGNCCDCSCHLNFSGTK